MGVLKQVLTLLLPSPYLEGPVEINYFVNEPSWPARIFKLDSIPKLKVCMENPQPLQLKYPIEQARDPGEQLSLSCLLEILFV